MPPRFATLNDVQADTPMVSVKSMENRLVLTYIWKLAVASGMLRTRFGAFLRMTCVGFWWLTS